MVPDKFNMVDMGGIDLIMMQGEEVPGLYNRLVESIAQCRYQCLYNWLFDGVIIPPTYVEMEVNEDDEVAINEGVTVSSDDVIHIYSLVPPTPEPVINPISIIENGVYTVPEGVDGFDPVTVEVPVPEPVIVPLSADENRIYTVPEGVDGFNPVTVDVPDPPLQELVLTENGVYTPSVGNYGFSKVTASVSGDNYFKKLEPIHPDFSGGYISGGGWYINQNQSTTDIYQLESGKRYHITLGSVVGNRFRVAAFQEDIYYSSVAVTGVALGSSDTTQPYRMSYSGGNNIYYYQANNGYIYLAVGKANSHVVGIKSYVFEVLY